jgi:hypothetical protein
MKTYDAKDVKITWGDIELTGFAEGTVVTIKADDDEKDAKRYRWIRDNITERPTDATTYDGTEDKTQYVLPLLISWADFCGSITLDEAIDFKLQEAINYEEEK